MAIKRIGNININYTPTEAQTQLYNALGRDAGASTDSGSNNFLQKRLNSIENAFGTTGAAIYSKVNDDLQNARTANLLEEGQNKINDIYKKYGYNNADDYYRAKEATQGGILDKYGYNDSAFWDQRAAADAAGDTAKIAQLEAERNKVIAGLSDEDAQKVNYFENIQNKLKNQANDFSNTMKKNADDYRDYAQNNYVSQKINQDRGKFLGSAMNTLSTGFDVLSMAAGIPNGALINAGQGAFEGIADELEQNGFQNFDLGRAGLNAATGAAAGAATGALNTKIGNRMSANGGNIFNVDNILGNAANSIAKTGIGRGALSGAVGGAVGAGLGSALSGQDVGTGIANTLSGAGQGALQGAMVGGAMSAANRVGNAALNRVAPKLSQSLQENAARNATYGDTMREQFKGAWNSGDSGTAEFLKTVPNRMQNLANKVNNSPLRNIGGTLQDVSGEQNANAMPQDIQNMRVNDNNYNSEESKNFAKDILDWEENVTGKRWQLNKGTREEWSGTRDFRESEMASALADPNRRQSVIDALNQTEYELRYGNGGQKLDTNRITVQDALDSLNEIKAKYGLPTTDQTSYEEIANWGMEEPITQSPETEVYRTLAGETEQKDLTSVFEPESANAIQSRNKGQSVGEQLINAAKTQKYGALYDALDNKTAARAIQTGAPEALSKLGVQPENYLEAAKTSNYINKVVSDLADESGVKVKVTDLPQQLSADNLDVLMSDTATKKYNSYIKQIVPDGTTPDEYSAGYLLQKSRELGTKAANLRGNTDDVNTLRAALTDAKYKLRDLATDALEGAEITGDLTNDNIAKGLSKLGANEKIQDYYTEAVDGKAPTISDYIRRSSLFEQARDMGTQIEAEKYTRSASKASTNPLTKIWNASGLDQPVNVLLRNTVAPIAGAATNIAGKTIKGAGDLAASYKNLPTMDQTRLYNTLGREIGLQEGEKAAGNYISQAAESAGPVTLESMANTPVNTNATSVYNSLYGNTTKTTTSGNYYANLLERAMQMAMDDGNATAFAALYNMYNENAQKQGKDYSNPTNWSATDRSNLLKAQNGLSQIKQLEDAYNNAVGESGGNAIQGTLRQWSNNLSAGNLDPSAENYVKQANSLGAGIIKNLVNLGSTEYDAARYIDYLPKLTDTKEQAQQKLQTLYNAYNDAINNLYAVYSM